LDLGPLVLVALVPLLWAWRGTGPGAAAALGFVAGAVFFGFIVSWTLNFGAIAFVPFVIVLSLWWALAGAIVGWLGSRRVPSPVLVAAVWVLVEVGRGRWPFGGFAWGEVGYALHDFPMARWLAAWGGVALVSLAVVVVNGFVLEALVSPRRRRRAAAAFAGVAVIGLVAGALLPSLTPTGQLRVAVVQGNDKNRDLTEAEAAARYLPTNHLRLAERIRGRVDLVVLPESSLDADPRLDPWLDEQLTALARRLGAAVLANATTEDASGGRVHNTNFLYGPSGRVPVIYRKQHLVPFGEFVPWRSRLTWVRELRAVPRDFAPGRTRTLFNVAGHRLGTLICFESAFPFLARAFAHDGAEALVVTTNNRSFGRSANAAQHLAMGQLRAAETGRPLVQAAISGITGIIDAGGDLKAQTRLFDPTVLQGEITARRGRTPYVAIGEWALVLAALVLGGGVWRRVGSRAAKT
jgi:apolipoprotein N-acyltransferase